MTEIDDRKINNNTAMMDGNNIDGIDEMATILAVAMIGEAEEIGGALPEEEAAVLVVNNNGVKAMTREILTGTNVFDHIDFLKFFA
jgi:hypothetical protein